MTRHPQDQADRIDERDASEEIDPAYRPNQVRLALAQLLSGVGIASGVAVGGLLTQDLSGNESLAGLAQTCTVLGAALVSLPLARLATSAGRRRALTVGFGVGFVGAAFILLAAWVEFVPLLMLGMLCVGSATAAGLQSRYAATDLAPAHQRGRAMSIVVWATTVGSVAGPNLTEPGADLGTAMGMNHLVGPYLFSVVAFGLATAVVFTLRSPRAASTTTTRTRLRMRDCIAVARRNRAATYGLVAVVTGQMMMSSVMVMTPIHMHSEGLALHLVGIVISLHILGMYGLSPLFGWLVDKIGPRAVIAVGIALFVVAFVIGIFDAVNASQMARISIALIFLGLGWSACLIAGSTLLSQSVDEAERVPMQGTTDAVMNFGAAAMAGLSGPILSAGGFLWINLTATVILATLVLAGVRDRLAAR